MGHVFAGIPGAQLEAQLFEFFAKFRQLSVSLRVGAARGGT